MQAASKFRPKGPISLTVLWDQAGENLHHHTFCNYYSSDISAWARTDTHTKAGQKPPLYTEMLREGRTVKVLRFAHSTPLWTKTVPGGSSKDAAVWVNTRFFRRRQNHEDGKAGGSVQGRLQVRYTVSVGAESWHQEGSGPASPEVPHQKRRPPFSLTPPPLAP